MNKFSKALIIIGIIFVILFVGFAILGFWHKGQLKKTAEAIDRINSRKITLDDVMGKNLPLKPDQKINDSTIAGIDANNNAIRDDVELEIFSRYPNSAKIRAAMLQYAQALQLELTEVFDSETFVSTLKKEDYGSLCISETVLNEELKTALSISNSRRKEIEDIVFNISMRKERHLENLKKYLATYSSKAGIRCDINFSSLPD